MKLSKHTICCFMLFTTIYSFGQDIQKHQWKERVLLIITNDEDNDTYAKQVDEFNEATSDLKERRLVIYRVSPSFYRTGLDQTKKIASAKLYKKYKQTNASVEVVLIGLDGGVKSRKSSIVTKKEVFDLIDSMPMRRSEMKNKN